MRLVGGVDWIDMHCTGGWVRPRSGLDGRGKSRPLPDFDPRTVHPEANRNSYVITLYFRPRLNTGVDAVTEKYFCVDSIN